MTNANLVCDKQIQIDRSGQGHAWKNIDAEEIPPNIVQEIEAEIIDGKVTEGAIIVASNGLHYRWQEA